MAKNAPDFAPRNVYRVPASYVAGGIQPAGASKFAAGAAFTLAGGAFSIILPVAGSAKFAARIKTATGGGTLAAAFGYLADGDKGAFTAYTTGNPSNATVTAGTEQILTSNTNGEDYVQFTFTPGADGTMTYFDLAQI